jgi:hypothetical protein
VTRKPAWPDCGKQPRPGIRKPDSDKAAAPSVGICYIRLSGDDCTDEVSAPRRNGTVYGRVTSANRLPILQMNDSWMVLIAQMNDTEQVRYTESSS